MMTNSRGRRPAGHISFARSITRLRQEVLRDLLRDRDPLGRALMTGLNIALCAFYISSYFGKNTYTMTTLENYLILSDQTKVSRGILL